MKHLSYEDFYEQFWDYVSGKIVTDHYFFNHEDMFRAITKDVYDIYIVDEARIHPKYYSRVVESIFYNMAQYKPTEKPKKDPNSLDFDYDRVEFD